jgi:hypothetical protein
MKQITMNGTAKALQVAAVLFLFGNSFIAPGDTKTAATINKAVAVDANENYEQETKRSTSYFHEVDGDKLKQSYYLHPTISTGAINAVRPVYTAFPLSPKKNETVQMIKK